MKRKYTKGELTKEILKGLAIGGIIVLSFAMPGFAQILTIFNPRDSKDKYRLRRTIDSLHKQKFVRVYYKNGKEIVEITEKGKRKVLAYKIDDMMIKPTKEWDKFWRIVIFDIPENRKKARNAINFKLKEIGFYPLQKSTFIIPYECRDEIDFVGEYFFVRKYIKYLLVKEIEDDQKLKKHFKLI